MHPSLRSGTGLALGVLTLLLSAPVAGASSCPGSTGTCPYSGTPQVFGQYGAKALRLPADVAVDAGGASWVSSYGLNQVKKYDSSGAVLVTLGNADGSAGSTNTSFAQPEGVGVDSSGNVYVADINNNRVVEYSSGGTFVRQLGTGTQGTSGNDLDQPQDVAVGSNGDVYVTDGGSEEKVVRLNGTTGAVTARYGTFTTLAGIASAGNWVYVIDQGTFPTTLHRMALDGTGDTSFSLHDFNTGHGVAVNAAGTELAVGISNGAELYSTSDATPGTWESNVVGGYGSQAGEFSTSFGLPFTTGVAYAGTDLEITDQGNARVQRLATDGTFVSELGGPSDGELWRPDGVTVGLGGATEGDIVVADTGYHRLQAFYGSTAAFLGRYGRNGGDGSDGSSTSTAEFSLPDDVFADPGALSGGTAGDLYVADTQNNRIVRLDHDGAYQGHLGVGLSSPMSVAVDAGKVYVADTQNDRIQVMDKATGSDMADYGAAGSDAGEFQHPEGVDVAPNGDIWVADTQNNRVQVRDHSTGTWTAYGAAGSGDGQFTFPTDVAYDATNGVVWVVDSFNSRIVALDTATGAFRAKFGTNGTGPGEFSYPQRVALDGAGGLLVTDSNNDRVERFSGVAVAAPVSVTLSVTGSSYSTGLLTTDQPTFSGTDSASTDSSLHVAIYRRSSSSGPTTGSDLGFDPAVSGGSYSAAFPGNLSDGYYEARAMRTSGTEASPAVDFRVDIHAPDPVVVDTPGDGTVVNTLTPTIGGRAGTAVGDGAVTVFLRQFGELKQTLHANPDANGGWTVTPGPLSDGGQYTVTANQSDDVGHSTDSAARTFRVIRPPVNLSAPAFSGAGTVGSIMHGAIGDWSGVGNGYISYWLRCADTTIANCVPVWGGAGTGGVDYKVTSDDVGYRLLLEVDASNQGGAAIAYSPSFTGVVPDPDLPAGANGAGAGSPKVKPPAVDHAPAQSSSACQTDLFFGPIGVHASCFKRVGLTWEATGSVAVNGLHLQADGGAKVVIDPMNLRIATHGSVKVVAGPAAVGGATIGPFTLYSGSFDWVMAPNVSLPSVSGLAQQIPNFPGVGQLPSLGDLSRLPGLGSLAGLPRLPDGLPDFSKLPVADLKDLRIPSLDDAHMQIPAFYLPVSALPAIKVSTPSGLAAFGLPIDGSFAMRLVNDGAQFDVGLGLPALGNLTASSTFKVFNDGRFEVDDLKAHADEVNAGIVDLKPIDIHYNAASDLWDGTAGAYLPFPGSPGFSATAAVQQGHLKKIGLGFDGNVAIGPSGVFLNHIDFALDNGPPQTFASQIRLSAGPKIAGVSAVGLNGKFTYQAADPAEYALTGDATLAGHKLASAGIDYHTDGYFHAFGNVGVSAGPFSANAAVDGWVDRSAFNLSGKVNISGPGLSIGAQGVASSVGIAACGNIGPLGAGAGYRWGASSFDIFSGCDLSSYQTVPGGRAVAPGGARSVTLPKGLTGESFAIHGASAAPKVTVSGPGGETMSTPLNSISAVQTSRYIVVQDPTANTTYVLLVTPAAGTWTITPLAGSSAITSVAQAHPLPRVRVSAAVRGQGQRRRLTWRLAPLAGQQVQFVERSGSVARVLGQTSRSSGSLSFSPAYGPGGARRIEAVVIQDGLVRTVRSVASYVAPPPARLAAPRHVRLKFHGAKLVVRWHGVRGATRYRILASVNGGQRLLIAPSGRRTSAAVPGVFSTSRATIRVTAVDAHLRDGHAGRARYVPRKVRRPRVPGLPARHAKHHSRA